MAPHIEEALRLLRLARRDEAAFKALAAAPEVGVEVALFHAQTGGTAGRRAGHPTPVDALDFRRLTPYAVEYRYDDEAPPLLTPVQAAVILQQVLAWADAKLRELT
jgi:hypothetical protein